MKNWFDTLSQEAHYIYVVCLDSAIERESVKKGHGLF